MSSNLLCRSIEPRKKSPARQHQVETKYTQAKGEKMNLHHKIRRLWLYACAFCSKRDKNIYKVFFWGIGWIFFRSLQAVRYWLAQQLAVGCRSIWLKPYIVENAFHIVSHRTKHENGPTDSILIASCQHELRTEYNAQQICFVREKQGKKYCNIWATNEREKSMVCLRLCVRCARDRTNVKLIGFICNECSWICSRWIWLAQHIIHIIAKRLRNDTIRSVCIMWTKNLSDLYGPGSGLLCIASSFRHIVSLNYQTTWVCVCVCVSLWPR